jgi:micrococcal nuclease
MRRDGDVTSTRTETCLWPIWLSVRVSAFLLTLAPRLMVRCILGSPPKSAASPQTSGAPLSPATTPPWQGTPTPPFLRPTASSLTITSVTSQVHAGASATVTAQVVPGADCHIAVIYRSGRSKAKGLVRKTADGLGQISWTWRVGTKATHGDWPMDITSEFGGESQSTRSYITVQ